MRFVIPALLLSLLLPPLHASAEEPIYPRVVRRDGEVCVQNLDAAGAVVESCRSDRADWTGLEKEAAAPETESIPAAPAEVTRGPRGDSGGGDPVRLGRLHARQADEAGKYFTGSLFGSALGGPGAWVTLATIGATSDPIPPGLGTWDNQVREHAYRQAFREEARDRRFWNAMGGGALGTAVFIGLVLLVAN